MEFKKVDINNFFNDNGRGKTNVLRKMNIGDMFEADVNTRTSWAAIARGIGIKIKTKKLDENTVAVVRVA